MKRIFVLVAFATAVASAHCGSFANIASAASSLAGVASNNTSTSAATTAGQNCGSALKNIYNQYIADGKKLDMGNMSNIANATSLASNFAAIKGHETDADFYKEFATGMISGSVNLVSTSNVDNVISGLSSIDLSALTAGVSGDNSTANKTLSSISSTASTVSSTANAISDLSSLLGMFGK